MVGRATELAELQACLAQAANDPGPIVHIVGAAGIGKSRLITELGVAACRLGLQKITLHCTDIGSASPLHPMIEYLRRLTQTVAKAGAVGLSASRPTRQRASRMAWEAPLEPTGCIEYAASPCTKSLTERARQILTTGLI